jgi:hypothetical protein
MIAAVIQAFLFALHLIPRLLTLTPLKHRGFLALPITHTSGLLVPSLFAVIARLIQAFSFLVLDNC